MTDEDQLQFPDSPVEMASWVRDRSLKVVQDLARVVSLFKDEIEVPDDVQGNLHFSLSGALANAMKLLAFASGHHLTADELSTLVGMVYERGEDALADLAVQFSTMDDSMVGQTSEIS